MQSDGFDRTYLFVSPHLDDVALSCGGYLRRLRAAGKRVIVATVATADVDQGTTVSWLARRNLAAWRLGDGCFASRRQEDEAALDLLGAQPRHLGFLDAMYRRDSLGTPFYTRSVHSSPHPDDERSIVPALSKALAEISRAQARGETVFLCPLGAGGHVDHLLVRRAVESTSEMDLTYYYEDYPYAVRSRVLRRQLTAPSDRVRWDQETVDLTGAEIEARIAAVACYPSQLPGLFPSAFERACEVARAHTPLFSRWFDAPPDVGAAAQRMARSMRAYVACVGGERYWRRVT